MNTHTRLEKASLNAQVKPSLSLIEPAELKLILSSNLAKQMKSPQMKLGIMLIQTLMLLPRRAKRMGDAAWYYTEQVHRNPGVAAQAKPGL